MHSKFSLLAMTLGVSLGGAGLVTLAFVSAGMLKAEARQARAKTVQCIQANAVSGPIVRDDGLLYFRGQPDRKHSYVATFKGGRCPGLNALSIVTIRSSGSRICAGDAVHAQATVTQVPGARCTLDSFVPFSGERNDPVSGITDAAN